MTLRQLKYIVSLSSRGVDEGLVDAFLDDHGRRSINDLTLIDGSALIDILLYRVPSIFTREIGAGFND